jgi:hypothetical protein
MLAETFVNLLDGRFSGRHITQCVQEHEIMDRAVVASGGYAHACFLQLSGICLAFVAKRVVLSGDDQRWRKPLELFGGRP